MSAKTGNSAPILLAVTLAMFPGLIANTAAAQSDTGIRDIPRTDTAAPVITRGSPPGTTPLETTYWKSIELAEKPTPAQGTKHALEGMSWQLVKFQGSDGATLTPDDRRSTPSRSAHVGSSPHASTATAGAGRGNPAPRIKCSSDHWR